MDGVDKFEVVEDEGLGIVDNPVHDDTDEDRDGQSRRYARTQHKDAQVDNQDDVEEQHGATLVEIARPPIRPDNIILQHHEDHHNGYETVDESPPDVLVVYDLVELLVEQAWLVEFGEVEGLLIGVHFVEDGVDHDGQGCKESIEQLV